jgi:hypothetical protein
VKAGANDDDAAAAANAAGDAKERALLSAGFDAQLPPPPPPPPPPPLLPPRPNRKRQRELPRWFRMPSASEVDAAWDAVAAEQQKAGKACDRAQAAAEAAALSVEKAEAALDALEPVPSLGVYVCASAHEQRRIDALEPGGEA